jgi:hypothetical protein
MLAKTLTSTLNLFKSAPLTRDIIACIEVILLAQDQMTWNSAMSSSGSNQVPLKDSSNDVRNLYLLLLVLSLDERPKVIFNFYTL